MFKNKLFYKIILSSTITYFELIFLRKYIIFNINVELVGIAHPHQRSHSSRDIFLVPLERRVVLCYSKTQAKKTVSSLSYSLFFSHLKCALVCKTECARVYF
jgi:hypothetical protein